MEEKLICSVNVIVTDQDIDDIMSMALEGGINYWCATAKDISDTCYGVQYVSEVISRGGILLLSDNESDDKYELTRAKLIKGLKQFIESDQFKNDFDGFRLDLCMFDAGDADCIIQYALFDDIIYG